MERKKKKTLFGCLTAVLVVFAVLGIAYSYLVFMPTGIERIEKPMTEVRERVSKMAAPSSVMPAPARVVPEKTTSTQTKALPAPSPNFLGEIDTFEITGGGYFLKYTVGRNMKRGIIYYTNEPANASDLWAVLSEKERIRLLGMLRYQLINIGQDSPPISESEAIQVNTELDRIETFLLQPHDGTPQGMNPKNSSLQYFYHAKALMAIERACRRGETEKAMRLLDGFLYTISMVGSVYLHDATMQRLFPADFILFFYDGLASIQNLPAEWRDHVRGTMQRIMAMKPPPEDVRLYTAARWRNQAETQLRIIPGPFLKQNAWHFFVGGKLESIANTALVPIAQRQIDLMAIAISRGDQSDCEREYKNVMTAFAAMNMGGHIGWNTQMIEDVKNRPAELAGYATTILATLDEDSGTTISIPIEKFADLPFYAGTNMDIRAARDLYAQKLGHQPYTPAEVDAFIKESQHGDDWRSLVTWYDPQRFHVWRSKPRHSDQRTTKTAFLRVQSADPKFEKELGVVLARKEKKN